MTLKRKKTVALLIMCVGTLVLILGASAGNYSMPLTVAGLVTASAGLILHLKWVRCPNCGEWLGRGSQKHCKSCGKEIDYSSVE